MIVVDATLAVAAAVPMDYTIQATNRLSAWKLEQIPLMAPTLFEYEVVTALRKSVILRILDHTDALDALDMILSLGIGMAGPNRGLDEQALYFAERIGQSKAYGGHYLALAARENAAFWTADRRLAASAEGAGLTWVHWIGEELPDHD